ncbi:TetR/AcrR family transcriptional regulator [Catenulispora sp. NF23]|uniref:TetR/AcrR family transcriptional regulator n=1 Tax=Catenulispora pinistramenti TaxID=2705254 RepID=A0ABS5KTN1_9ACTN|nr:TetR/AcrR family transcriptional regulator [Catenulispora pinistramenti]MBS2533678.1 TetR/AcrR family transcriptional regulator [Catenulispora pinistramenti]MBS2549418.1 TetR/AcrR family transcriptional regulator [Catenulispora pinistramenti]
MRADAERNRARILDTAIAAFAAEGLGVSVHEIARRAGVGTGTVSRHFPTKDALFEAIVADRVGRIVDRVQALAESPDQREAFVEFLTILTEEGAANVGIAQAFAGAGYDMDAAATAGGYDFDAAMAAALCRAQEAHVVRADADVADIKALMVSCMSRGSADQATRARMIDIVARGLRPPESATQ